MTTIEIPHNADLIAALDALGIPWTPVKPPNGTQGLIGVTMDPGADARLETLIGLLSQLRWSYSPARIVQLEIGGWEMDHAN